MYEYKLEAHLNSLCTQYPQYVNLHSTWTLNKCACSDLLKSVVIHYPHFSMHDASHSEAIISNIEMLLGDRIEKLSPTDTWLLLHAAYAHDLGMVIEWGKIKAVWETPEFQNYLFSLTTSTDPDLRKAAEFIQHIEDMSSSQTWPLETHRYVNLINASYFRSQHAKLSKEHIATFSQKISGFDLDLGHNNLIQPRIVKLLGQICSLHTASLDTVLDLDYQTNGFGSDYAHPRFVAMLLRLGDLLDIDNGRFNTGAVLSSGGLPQTSIPHEEKHEATTHLLITPNEIRFRSDCPNSNSYLETRQFVTWLEDEITFLTRYWSKIVPKGLGGYAPCFDCKELLINGVPDIEGVAGLKFEISQDKAFQIIEGSNIYEDRFVFIREVIQNALDASKLQLWNDLSSGTYDSWLSPDLYSNKSAIQPYHLSAEIYNSYPITINISTLENGQTQVEVSDRGTGISVDSFKRMCNVGTSNSTSSYIQQSIQNMPNWLRPTAGFGIGLQSIFLLTDQFEIETSTGTESFHAIVHSKRTGGYLQLQRSQALSPRGTTIRMQFQMPNYFRFSFGRETNYYLETALDPIAPTNHTGEARVLEAIRTNCNSPLFPTHVTCENIPNPTSDTLFHLPINNENLQKFDDRYYYKLKKTIDEVDLWDSETATYCNFNFSTSLHPSNDFKFKGIDVHHKAPNLNLDGISTLIDVYGLDTKETITLDRSSFTHKGKKQVTDLSCDCTKIFIEIILDFLNKNPDALPSNTKFNPYALWKICDDNQRQRIPKAILKSIQDEAPIISKKDQKFNVTNISVTKLITNLANQRFMNLHHFMTGTQQNPINDQQILKILNSAQLPIKSIIIDSALTNELLTHSLHTIEVPVLGEPLLLYTISQDHECAPISVNDTTRKALLKGLGQQISGMYYQNIYGHKIRAKRYAIPAIKKYSHLAVNTLPYGAEYPLRIRVFWILSPFVREDEEARPKLSRDDFIERVTSSETFPHLVTYVKEHSIQKEGISEDHIIDSYKNLLAEYYNIMQESEASTDDTLSH